MGERGNPKHENALKKQKKGGGCGKEKNPPPRKPGNCKEGGTGIGRGGK